MTDALAPREAWVTYKDGIWRQIFHAPSTPNEWQRGLWVPLKDGEPGRWEAMRYLLTATGGEQIRLYTLPKTRTVGINLFHDPGTTHQLEVPADMTDAELLERIRKAVER